MASELRRFTRAVAINGGLWALGSGIASATTVSYLAMDYGAAGLALSFMLAAPKLTSLVQLVQPFVPARAASRKALCVGGLFASSLSLALLPVALTFVERRDAGAALPVLIAGWAFYHLLEYIGAAALWSWMRDEIPSRVRGRAWGRRERWMAFGRFGGLFVGAGLAELGRGDWSAWPFVETVQAFVQNYAFSVRHALIGLGGTILAASILPLLRLRDRRRDPKRSPAEQYVQAFREPAFLKLVAFAVALSFANGLLQAPQGLFPYRVLGISLTTMLLLRAILFAGQGAVAGWFGRRFDAGGHRRWMLSCQSIATAGGALFLVATPQATWPFYLAWVLWIAYAGLNVAIPDLTLRFAPPGSAGPWVALSFSLSAVSYGVATVLGGWAFDTLPLGEWFGLGDAARDRYDAFFIVGACLRLVAAGFLFLLPTTLSVERLRPVTAGDADVGEPDQAARRSGGSS